MYQWIVFTHVLGVFGFLLAHGASAAVAFKVRGEREIARVRALLDLSRGAAAVANISLLVLLTAGITAGIMGRWWGRGWIWTALGLFILMSVTMSPLGSRPLNRIRQLVHAGNSSRSETINHSPLDTSAEKQRAIMLDATHPWLLTVIGSGGLILILWLMMFKPF